VRFFFDNTLPPRLAQAIDVLLGGADKVMHLTERFPADTKDVEWLSVLGNEGDWIIISGDPRITRNPHERHVWQEAELTAFFLKKGWSNQKFWIQTAKLIQWWPDIMEQSKRVAPGAGFIVPVQHSGRFEQVRLA